MKRAIRSILVFLTVACLAFCGTACKPTSSSVDSSEDSSESSIDSIREDTDNYLVRNNTSGYKVLVSENPTPTELTAAGEIVDYIAQSTGVVLEQTDEAQENASTSGQYISVGRTELYEEQSFEAEDLNKEGFILKTVGNTLFIVGEQDCGTIYGAYDFLEKQFGIKFLSAYYEYVPTISEIKLSKFDDVEIPTFAHRTYFYKVTQDPELCAKFRLYLTVTHATTDEDAMKWGAYYAKDSYVSSMNQLVRYQDHYSQHPEWWSTSSTSTMMQPCWSNSFNADGTPKSGDTFYHQYVQELFDTIMNAEIRHSYVFLGQEDNNNFCGCADCQELKEATGGTEAGLWVIFLNAISTEIKQKLREAGNPHDDMLFGMFAYSRTENPPVHQDENGVYVADCPQVDPNDDVYIMFAPTTACFLHSIDDETCAKNRMDAYQKMEGWRAVCKNFYIFQYGTNFNGTLLWYPHESSLIGYFDYWREIGVSDFLIQGMSISYQGYQSDLDCYIISKLMWDVDRNINDIVHEFNRYMYGETAGAYIDDYYTYMNAYFMNRALDSDNAHLGIYLSGAPWLTTTETLNKNFVYGAYTYYDNAVAAIENDETMSQSQKEQYFYNLKKVKVQIMYMQYLVYDSVWATTEQARFNFMLEFFDLCDELEIIRFGEGMPVSDARKAELGDL